MASGKIRKRLSKSLQYYVCTSRTKPENRNILADDLQLFLSGGFRDIKRSVMITKTSEIDMQQFCSNHKESDPRIIPDVLDAVQEQDIGFFYGVGKTMMLKARQKMHWSKLKTGDIIGKACQFVISMIL